MTLDNANPAHEALGYGTGFHTEEATCEISQQAVDDSEGRHVNTTAVRRR